MNGKKRRLGKGLDALIPDKLESEEVISDQIISEKEKAINDKVIKGDVISDKLESEKDSVVSKEVISEKGEAVSTQIISETKTTETLISDKLKIDKVVLEKAIEEGKRNPRVVIWSPKSSIVLRILKKTIPEFSISKEASELLEEAIKRKYLEIWKLVEEEIEEKR